MWNQKKTRQLKKLYPRLDNHEIAEIIEESTSMIVRKARELNLEKDEGSLDPFWDFLDESMLRDLYLSYNKSDMARILGKTEDQINEKLLEMGLVKSTRWSDIEMTSLLNTYANTPNQVLAKWLNKKPYEIEHFAFRMGLRKSKDYYANVENSDEEIALVKKANEEYHRSMNVSRGHYICSKILEYLFPLHKVVPEEPIGGLRLDLYIPDFNIAIEYDGIQHSEFVEFYHGNRYEFERGKERDYSKSRMCEERGIGIIRIYHDETLSVGLVRAKMKEVM